MGSESIDFSLKNVWKSWWAYRKGKKLCPELHEFQYYLEKNLNQLACDLQIGCYQHGTYRTFTVSERKRREISVAPIRDRIVHRLLYDHLVPIFDRTFIFDAWSCRKGKGLLGAIERVQYFLRLYPRAFVWRADVKKFFDHINHEILKNLIARRVPSSRTTALINQVIRSFCVEAGKGIPIGNLTSQIFANIYLNELDRYVKHTLKPMAYARYGDDFVIFDQNSEGLTAKKMLVQNFLTEKLNLVLHLQNEFLGPAPSGLHFLGVWLYPKGRCLDTRSWNRAIRNLNPFNISSYSGLVGHHSKFKKQKEFLWRALKTLETSDG